MTKSAIFLVCGNPCRHRTSWIICARGFPTAEWCYVCGAYRGLDSTSSNSAVPRTVWIRPTGDPENNPTEKLKYKVRRLKP